MYPDESSRVVVYCLGGRNMLVWCMHNGLWICIWLHRWNVFGSSLPFACLIVLCVILLFCDDHKIIDVSRSERFSWSTGEWWLCCIVHLGWSWCFISFRWAFVRVTTHVFCLTRDILYSFLLYIWFFLWHRGVPYVVRSEFKL